MHLPASPALPSLDPEVLLPVREFLRLLPGTHVPDASRLLLDAWFNALVEDQDVMLGEHSLGCADQEVLFMARETGMTCVTPLGAERLIDAYRRGALPRTAAGKLGEPAQTALAYANSYAALAGLSGARTEGQQREAAALAARRAEFDSLVNHPEAVPESRFDYPLLDAIFWKHLGAGSGTMHIGGVTVAKSLARYASNSGKHTDHAVRFDWVSVDGTPRFVEKPSQFEMNRRNDERRNWGLPA